MVRRVALLAVVLAWSYLGQVLMKKGVQAVGVIRISELVSRPLQTLSALLANARVILGFASSGVGAIFYLAVLSDTDLTKALPMLGAMGYVILPVVGIVFLNEAVTLGRVVGILVILIGMAILAYH